MRAIRTLSQDGVATISVFVVTLGMLVLGSLGADPPASLTSEQRSAAQAALSSFNSLIGGWRGVGQVRRGSTQGAWQEKSSWSWDFQSDSVALICTVTDGKLLESGRLMCDPSTHAFHFDATGPSEQLRQYTGQLQDNRLVLLSEVDEGGEQHRLTITLLNENRTLVLFEKRAPGQEAFFREAEVGYTREGVRLARPGGGQPECIVTGGAGTIAVMYEGKTYYVCCTGCKQAFEDDPAGIIAAANERRKKEQLGK